MPLVALRGITRIRLDKKKFQEIPLKLLTFCLCIC